MGQRGAGRRGAAHGRAGNGGAERSTAGQSPEAPASLAAQQRLWRLGVECLSDEELVALVAGAGAAGGLGLHELGQLPPEELLEHAGFSATAAARVLAGVELGRRVVRGGDAGQPRLGSPQAIYDWARPRLAAGRREAFHVLCLNPRHLLLRHVRVAVGSADQCPVDPREALAPAVACRASSLVLVHNHPSGDPEPSAADLALTRQLKEGARLLCIRLVDHLVVTEAGYVSMSARGLLGDERPSWTRLTA
jgi:DNA repair protein RadC